jgi:tellurite resistance protein TerC
LLLFDLLVLHRKPKVLSTKRAAESAGWIAIGLGFTFAIWAWFGVSAAGEYISATSSRRASASTTFVWALILSYFLVPPMYQHRVLFWDLRALILRGDVHLRRRGDHPALRLGALHLRRVPHLHAGKLVFSDNDHVDPGNSGFLKTPPGRAEHRSARRSEAVHGAERRWLATPLFSVLLLVEATDVVFAVDSVPAVLAVSHEQFIVFASNVRIMGLRAMYFLIADMHGRSAICRKGSRSSSPSSA